MSPANQSESYLSATSELLARLQKLISVEQAAANLHADAIRAGVNDLETKDKWMRAHQAVKACMKELAVLQEANGPKIDSRPPVPTSVIDAIVAYGNSDQAGSYAAGDQALGEVVNRLRDWAQSLKKYGVAVSAEQLDIAVRQVLDRVLWTREASEHNKLILTGALVSAMGISEEQWNLHTLERVVVADPKPVFGWVREETTGTRAFEPIFIMGPTPPANSKATYIPVVKLKD